MKKILTIAGSDSCGGAGIQADLKTIALMGEYGLSVITALTAQNTQGVFGIHPVPLDFIASQWDAVVSDISVDAVKTGMLWDEKVIKLISQKLRKSKIPIRVFDPVMMSKAGATLLKKGGRSAFISELLSLATIVTPNIPEAKILCGHAIRTIQDMEKAARRIYKMGAKNVLIKGGHRSGLAVDILFNGNQIFHFSRPRIKTVHTHGTGCTFASAIAVELTRNDSLPEAVEKAKNFTAAAISHAFPLGRGQGPTNPYASLGREVEIYRAIQALQESLRNLQMHKAGPLIPEVQSNLGYAIPSAQSVDDVVAFPGRISRYKDTVFTMAPPEPGGSRHIAKIILTAMAFDPNYRSAMNIRYNREIISKCRKQNLKIKRFDRRKEPDRIKKKEGASLEWGIGSVLQKSSQIPDVIYDTGDMGKEPIIRILGKIPQEVVNKVLCLL
ncbi:MAG: bifunctional hydroxymethylpyrimidine kinase/phosphomethylpyrimidine kinase [Deltaproteobacteria bacterium]|nr:bifunctional hydroxymethylpyrimidine kinase/phosphomethylpyrimidine kinase [Deltaproteobacteria bacterium]